VLSCFKRMFSNLTEINSREILYVHLKQIAEYSEHFLPEK